MSVRTPATRFNRLLKAMERAQKAQARLDAAKDEFHKAHMAMTSGERTAAAAGLGYEDLHDFMNSLGC